MKKLLIVFSLLSILLSITMISNCESGLFCCENQHSTASQCSTCSPHAETLYDFKDQTYTIAFSPEFIKNIFFTHINIQSTTVTRRLDRPPAQHKFIHV